MGLVTLVSGGLDSTLLAVLAQEEGVQQQPLFIDYGQICKDQELAACIRVHKEHNLPIPAEMDLNGYGKLVPSGLTEETLRVNEDAFLPGRNLLFLLAGSAYAYSNNIDRVAIGLLSERYSIFPDQTKIFVEMAQQLIRHIMGREIVILTPLIEYTKRDVIELANRKGISGTYSCHAGTENPCGQCVSCLEMINARVQGGD